MKKKYPRIYLGVLLVIPLVFLLLPSSFFDSGDSVCISILLFDRKCYGCGMTRAIQHLIHLDISVAYHYNKLSIFVLPLLISIYFKEIRKWYFLVKKK